MGILEHLHGEWTGRNGLRLLPTDELEWSPAAARLSPAAGGHATVMEYTWSDHDVPQSGVLLLAETEHRASGGDVEAVWLDTWHQQPFWMRLSGYTDDVGAVHLTGTYGENAGWRIHVSAFGDGLRLVMDNQPPDEEPYPVMEAELQHAPPG